VRYSIMRHAIALVLCGVFEVFCSVAMSAQTRKPPARKAAPPAPLKTEAPEMTCPTPLGSGVKTKLTFCDVLTGRDPATGIRVKLPPHKGPVTITFNLHNRHLYSEEQASGPRAYARYTATIGILAMDNTLISRAVVQSEYRSPADLVDRVGGGAGPGGVKAVAPTGSELVAVSIPEEENEVSLLGEKLLVERLDGVTTYTQAGRPIADISNVSIEYHPAPAAKKPTGAAGRRGGRGGQ
jgi:hypothetical protein